MAETVKPLSLVFAARSLYIFLDLRVMPTSHRGKDRTGGTPA